MSNVSGCGCGSSTAVVSSDCHTDSCKKPCEPAPKDCSPCPPKDCFQRETIGDIKFVKLPGGTVQLGSDNSSDDNPRHCATIQPISVAETEVTNDQMEAYIREMGCNTHAQLAQDRQGNITILKRGTESDLDCKCDRAFDEGVERQLECGALTYLGVYRVVPKRKEDRYGACDGLAALSAEFYCGNNPAVRVTWYEAFGFTEYLSQKTGRNVRLLTGDEWEYAARGTDALEYATRNGQLEDHMGRKLANYGQDWWTGSTTAVKSYDPNPSGLYDMTGNVWEWTSGWWDSREQYRVLRGGSWILNLPRVLRGAYRNRLHPDVGCDDVGFRVAAAP